MLRLTVLVLLSTPAVVRAEHAVDSQKVVDALVQGNRRFASGHPRHPHAKPKDVRRTGHEGQHPASMVLACSDSRVAPEILFDQGIGDMFSIRVAGNVANDDELASIEYAASHLHVPVLVVLGHTKCGAVTAVVENEPLNDHLKHLTVHIHEAVKHEQAAHPTSNKEALVEFAVRENVREAVEGVLRDSDVLRKLVDSGKLRVVGAVYDIETGAVRWLDRETAH